MSDDFEVFVDAVKLAFGPFWPGAWKTEKAREFSRWNHVFPHCQFSPLEFYASLEEALTRGKLPELEMGRVTWKERGLFSARREYLRIRRDRYVYDICAAPFGEDFFFSSWLVILPRSFSAMHILGMIATFAMFFFLHRYEGLKGLAGAGGAFGIVCLMVRFRILGGLIADRVGIEDYLSGMTIIGAIYDVYLRPLTYFEQDTASMFEKSVHGAMMEIIDGLTEPKGIRMLTELERRAEHFNSPLWVSFYKK